MRVDTPAPVSSSANTSSTSAMVSRLALLDFRRVAVDLVGVAVRLLGVVAALRRAGVSGGSCLILEAVFLVGLGVLRPAAGLCAAFATAFLAGLSAAFLMVPGSGGRFSGVCTVFVGGLCTTDAFRPVPVAAERSFLGLGVAVFALDRRGGVFLGLAGECFLGLFTAASFLAGDTAAAFFGLGVGSFFFGLGVASLLLTLDAFLGRPGDLFGLSVWAFCPLGLGVCAFSEDFGTLRPGLGVSNLPGLLFLATLRGGLDDTLFVLRLCADMGSSLAARVFRACDTDLFALSPPRLRSPVFTGVNGVGSDGGTEPLFRRRPLAGLVNSVCHSSPFGVDLRLSLSW